MLIKRERQQQSDNENKKNSQVRNSSVVLKWEFISDAWKYAFDIIFENSPQCF